MKKSRKKKMGKNQKIEYSFGMSIAALILGGLSLIYAKITNGAIAEVLQSMMHKNDRRR